MIQIFILLQSNVDSLAMAEAGEVNMTLLQLLLKGGYFMIPILLLSILAVYIYIDRYFQIKKASSIGEDFMRNITDYILGGNLDGAEALCKNEDGPIARMIAKGVRRIGKPIKAIEMSVENVGKLEVLKIENRLGWLATIAGAAPMIGFLGTVTGMIRAFFNISNAGNNIDPGMLAGGIYEAMLTTAAGLAVGIVAYIGYNHLVGMVSKLIFKMEANSVAFLDVLQEPANS